MTCLLYTSSGQRSAVGDKTHLRICPAAEKIPEKAPSILAVFTLVDRDKSAIAVSYTHLVTVLRTTVVPMLIAMAMSMPMIMGMWDFSSGAVVYAAAILGANVASVTNTGVLGLCVSAMLIAVLLTAFSGVLYNLMKIPSLVLTLGLVMVRCV